MREKLIDEMLKLIKLHKPDDAWINVQAGLLILGFNDVKKFIESVNYHGIKNIEVEDGEYETKYSIRLIYKGFEVQLKYMKNKKNVETVKILDVDKI
jgi:hypothetical protein